MLYSLFCTEYSHWLIFIVHFLGLIHEVRFPHFFLGPLLFVFFAAFLSPRCLCFLLALPHTLLVGIEVRAVKRSGDGGPKPMIFKSENEHVNYLHIHFITFYVHRFRLDFPSEFLCQQGDAHPIAKKWNISRYVKIIWAIFVFSCSWRRNSRWKISKRSLIRTLCVMNEYLTFYLFW